MQKYFGQKPSDEHGAQSNANGGTAASGAVPGLQRSISAEAKEAEAAKAAEDEKLLLADIAQALQTAIENPDLRETVDS